MKNQNNTTIAEYMGATFYEGVWRVDSSKCSVAHILDNCQDDELKFDSSWDWLMPVVEKLESEGYEMDICENFVEVSYGPDETYVGDFVEKTKFKAVLAACVKIING